MGGFGQKFPTLAGVPPERQGLVQPPVPPERIAEFYKAMELAKQKFGDKLPDWLLDNMIMNYFGESLEQSVSGAQALTGRKSTWDERLGGIADIAYGGMQAAAPITVPLGMITDPALTLTGLGTGAAATYGTEALGRKLGWGPGTTKLAGLISGVLAGGYAGRPSRPGRPGPLERVGRLWERIPKGSERGAIPIEPKPGEPIPSEQATIKREPEQVPHPAVAGGPGRELPAAPEKAPAAPVTAAAVTQKRPAGNPDIQRVVNDYNARRGLPRVDHSKYHPLDEKFGRRVADAYDALKEDNSADPRVRAAYEALMRETKEQWNHLTANGYKLEPWTKEGQPYANSHEMVADLRDNKHLYFYTGGQPHPFLSAIDPDTGLSYNDMFRAVHDAWGHAAAGYGFGPRGEEGAHDMHSQSFSPLARQAMTTETRGQNSWVNFGKHNYDEGGLLNIPADKKPFAVQKVDLLPEEFHQRAGERFRPEAAPVPPPVPKARDVKARTMEDLERRIPQEVRAVSPDPTRTVTGQPFHSLDLEKPGEGFQPLVQLGPEKADQLLQQAWNDSIRESEVEGGSAARRVVEETGARPPDASWWHKAFLLPLRNRFWYELSGESFTGKHIDVPRDLQPTVIDMVAATSGGVKPLANAKRGFSVLAEHLQKIPVMTDLRDPASVRNALARMGQAVRRTLKYGNFSGTMQLTSGLSSERPLPTNDVQVADIFGVKGEDIANNPVLYEVLSRFFLKMRDMQNAHLPGNAQPWETWQMQAPAWVYNRLLKDPGSLPDDYSQVLPKIIRQLAAAGVPTPGGKITLQTLMDERTPNILSSTRERFLSTPITTAEVATKLTPQGLVARNLYRQLDQLDPELPWVRKARQAYQQIQRNTMKALMSRKGGNKELGIPAEPSLISQLTSLIVGRPVNVSRIDRLGYGTFEGEINPNMRIPLTGRAGQVWITLDRTQQEALLSMLGQDLHQEAMASSLFENVKPGETPDTYSVFLRRTDNLVNEAAITKFSNKLGHPVNVTQVPNGVLIDIHMNFPEGAPRYGPTREAVVAAGREAFAGDAGIQGSTIKGRKYDSNLVPSNEYEGKIDAWKTSQRPSRVPGGDRRGVGRAGTTTERTRNLARVRKKIQTHARVRDKKFGDWTETTGARLRKHLASQGP